MIAAKKSAWMATFSITSDKTNLFHKLAKHEKKQQNTFSHSMSDSAWIQTAEKIAFKWNECFQCQIHNIDTHDQTVARIQ